MKNTTKLRSNMYLVKPGSIVDLSKMPTVDDAYIKCSKKKGMERTEEIKGRLDDLQEIMYAEHKHAYAIVLQGMDTSGKDGVIRRVFTAFNPQGMRVENFKAPTQEERDHDYQWRIHNKAPKKGEIVIFNRSHYEDVGIVRVNQLAPLDKIEKRYRQINDFERMLVEEGTTILKFFLHISPEKSGENLEERLTDPTKHWKMNLNDLKEREKWSQYMEAYSIALGETSTDFAPWHVIPSDRKWYRDLVIADVVMTDMVSKDMQYPKPDFDPKKIKIAKIKYP